MIRPVILLWNAGAHMDMVNKYGICPYTGYLKSNDLMFYKSSLFFMFSIVIVFFFFSRI